MKSLNKTSLILAFSTLVIGLALGWLFFNNSPAAEEHHHAAEQNAGQTENSIFTCSMHPKIRKNEPGDCPICGMELIPLATDNASIDPAAISMSASAMQLAKVKTMAVSKIKANKTLRLNGKVQADERLLFTQSSHIAVRIEKLAVNFKGEFVNKGQVIAHVYSPALVTAQEELLEAFKIKEAQPALFSAAKEKLKNWKLSDKQITQILSSKKTMESFPILANASGYVSQVLLQSGDYLKQGEAIFEIADLSQVWLLFDVYEEDLNWLKKGDSINYSIRSLPGKTFAGPITFIDPVIDPKTRAAQVRVEAANTGLLLKPEMFASGILEVDIQSDSSRLSIPKSALMWTGKRSVVYVMQKTPESFSFKMREVVIGAELDDHFVIKSGLEAGEEIAVNGTFSIDAAAQLAGKPSMMNPAGGAKMSGHNHGSQKTKPTNEKVNASNVSLSAAAKATLQALFRAYFTLKEALVIDDLAQSQTAFHSFASALSEIDHRLFEGEAHLLWMQELENLKKATEQSANKVDIEALRARFFKISNAMVHISEAFKPLSNALYIQHCPMADSNNGADWLSLEQEILNPYFGQSMLTCGSVIKTID